MTSQAMAQRIEHWPTDKLVFYARNPRKNDAAVDRMCSSIREFGFKVPVLARSDGEVVDGHLRLKAALECEEIAAFFGKIVKRDDHLMDATRYLIVSGRLLMRIAPEPSPPPSPTRRVGGDAWMA